MNTQLGQINGSTEENIQGVLTHDVFKNGKLHHTETFECKLEVHSEEEDEQESATNQQMTGNYNNPELKEETDDPKRTTEDESMAVEALRQLGGMFASMPVAESTTAPAPYRQHVCSICGESFERKTDLGNHIVCHQVDRPHACRTCGNLFRRKADLQNHMVCHQVERPHRCPQCGADFQRPSSLTNHMKIHSYSPGRALVSYPQPNYQTFPAPPDQVPVPTYNGWNVNYTGGESLPSDQDMGYQNSVPPWEAPPGPVIESVATLQCNSDTQQSCSADNFAGSSTHMNFNAEGYGDDTAKSQEMSYDNSRRPHVCRHCGLGFARVKALQSHERLHQDHWGSPVECHKCEEMFPEEESLRRHQEMCVGKAQLPPPAAVLPCPPAQVSKVGKHACSECDKRFTTKQKLFRHMWIHRKRPHVCEVCGLSLTDKVMLDEHRRTQHPSDTPFTCSECGKSFASRQGLWEHSRMHAGKGNVGGSPFLCQRCGKCFASRQGHLIHTRTHTGERPYGCRFCWKAFRDGGTLRKHERIHTGERPHVCPLCPRAFNQKVVLREHVRWVHAARNSDGCPLCGYLVGDREALCAHIVKHSDQLAAAVKAATKSKQGKDSTEPPTVTFSTFEVQEVLPEVKNEYVCDMCGEAFRVRTELLDHVRIHI